MKEEMRAGPSRPPDPLGTPLPEPLLWMPSDHRVKGGHMVQLERTADALQRNGLRVRFEYSLSPRQGTVNVIHGFGLKPEHIRRWHVRGLPVVVSPIYWDQAYRVQGGRRSSPVRHVAGRLFRAGRFGKAALQGNISLTKTCMAYLPGEIAHIATFEAADLILPNSDGEAEAIRQDLRISTPMHFVPNGVDPTCFSPPASLFTDRDSVLYVGRIEPHKNQLGLIDALRGSGLPLVIAGYEHPDHHQYAERCRAAGKGWVQFVSGVTPSEAAELYRSARVHVLPSWFETTGLVSLEAALCGCNIVSTSRGHAREYLGDLAWYCDPSQPESILRAVQQAWHHGPVTKLADHVRKHFTWDHVAAATIQAYEEVLSHPDA